MNYKTEYLNFLLESEIYSLPSAKIMSDNDFALAVWKNYRITDYEDGGIVERDSGWGYKKYGFGEIFVNQKNDLFFWKKALNNHFDVLFLEEFQNDFPITKELLNEECCIEWFKNKKYQEQILNNISWDSEDNQQLLKNGILKETDEKNYFETKIDKLIVKIKNKKDIEELLLKNPKLTSLLNKEQKEQLSNDIIINILTRHPKQFVFLKEVDDIKNNIEYVKLSLKDFDNYEGLSEQLKENDDIVELFAKLHGNSNLTEKNFNKLNEKTKNKSLEFNPSVFGNLTNNFDKNKKYFFATFAKNKKILLEISFNLIQKNIDILKSNKSFIDEVKIEIEKINKTELSDYISRILLIGNSDSELKKAISKNIYLNILNECTKKLTKEKIIYLGDKLIKEYMNGEINKENTEKLFFQLRKYSPIEFNKELGKNNIFTIFYQNALKNKLDKEIGLIEEEEKTKNKI